MTDVHGNAITNDFLRENLLCFKKALFPYKKMLYGIPVNVYFRIVRGYTTRVFLSRFPNDAQEREGDCEEARNVLREDLNALFLLIS